MELKGLWQVTLPDGTHPIQLPGTLDMAKLGEPDTEVGFQRLRRGHTFTGTAVYERQVAIPADWEGWAAELFLERSRMTRVWLNGQEVPPLADCSLATPWRYNLTGLLHCGRENALTVKVDNHYTESGGIIGSSMATDETQTNWNGILGEMKLEKLPLIRLQRLTVLPDGDLRTLRVTARATNDAREAQSLSLALTGADLLPSPAVPLSLAPGETADITFPPIRIRPDTPRWDEEEGNLRSLSCVLSTGHQLQAAWGLRRFSVSSGFQFTLNSRVIFLRGEANCCVFPLTGCPPMTKAEWKAFLTKFMEYGVNIMRFHSWCPPEAAFAAADELGLLLQPELSQWDCTHAFEDASSREYYRRELLAIIRTYANHPSFVMLTLGNELQAGAEGHAAMDTLMELARRTDPTRLYANSSNPHYGGKGPDGASDFYTAQNVGDVMIRACSSHGQGAIHKTPCTDFTYAEGTAKVHAMGQPVYSFEVGQYESLPDYRQIQDYTGVTLPDNLEAGYALLRKSGREADYGKRVDATITLAYLGYKQEAEAALRTPGFGGLSLLGLQDFPGQGTALVGMMDAFARPKSHPLAKPVAFRKFFSSVVPLAFFPRMTFRASDRTELPLKLAHYGKAPLEGTLEYRFTAGDRVLAEGSLPLHALPGGLTDCGTVTLPHCTAPAMVELTLKAGEAENDYTYFVYEDHPDTDPGEVLVAPCLTKAAKARLKAGGKVLLSPPADSRALPHSIQGLFPTDFWSLGTFTTQEGGMGLYVNHRHPALAKFPTPDYGHWCWYGPSQGRPVILDDAPASLRPIVEVPDSMSRQHFMALLLECRTEGGSLMLSTMNLPALQHTPEGAQLLRSILSYMKSDAFRPETELPAAYLETLVVPVE